MTVEGEALKTSYAACRRVVRRSGSNFARCLWLLPRPKQQAMEALYAFLRITDDLGDQPAPAFQRRQALHQWRQALEAALQQAKIPPFEALEIEGLVSEEFLSGRLPDLETPPTDPFSHPATGQTAPTPPVPSSQTTEDSDRRVGADERAILPALVDTVRRFHIPTVYLDAVFEGVCMDLEPARYETFEQLALYCRRVASAVGLACLCIWGSHCREAAAPAIACGLAFQLTNILRDLKEDAQMGRVYVPMEDLVACGYTAETFPPTQPDDRFDRLIRRQTVRAEGFYRQAAPLWDYLDCSGRRIFGVMYETYRRLLDRIAQKPQQVLTDRVRLSGWEKLGVAVRWSLWPSRRWLF